MKIQLRYRLLALITVFVTSLFASVSLNAPASAAGLSVATLFKDYAVLQRNLPVPVWGTANNGTLVTVSFQGQVVSTTAANGTWKVNLAPMAASTSPSTLTITGGSSTITINNVQVGEVWVASGQSNIGIPGLAASTGGAAAVADSVNYNITFYKVENTVPNGTWQRALPGTVDDKSAVAYYYVRELARHQLAGIPIGVYQAGWSGSTITEWTHAKGNGSLYDSKIVPMQPYGIRGVFWYQGESDGSTLHGGSPDDYDVMLPALINEWRSDWGQGNFPFLVVQLPWLDNAAAGWPKVRDGQLTTWLSVPNTGMAVTCDLDLGTDIHPVNKEPIGYRMSLVARGLVYGETSLVYAGPVRDPSQSSIQGNQIVIGFTHIEGGLATSPAGSAPGPFKVAGSDGIYFDATAQIVGSTVVVSSASVPNPVSVRYVWDYSRGNLYNGAGMPASPFEINLGGGGPTPTPGPTATPTPTATPGGSTVMHVADILTTDVNGTPQTVFTKGNTVYWRVKIVDQNNVAVSGASVTTQGLKPNGSNWATLTATTAADGWALFSKTTNGGSPTGTYTINVTGVTKTGATYNPAANVKSSTTFTLQ